MGTPERLVNVVSCLPLPKYEWDEIKSTFEWIFDYFVSEPQTRRPPRLDRDTVIRLINMTDRKILVPVQATRRLLPALTKRQFKEIVRREVAERGGRVSKVNAFLIGRGVENKGHMIQETVEVDPGLVIETGTLGVIEGVDPDYFPSRLFVCWEGFQSYGRVDSNKRRSGIPSISLQPGEQYDLEILWGKTLEELGIGPLQKEVERFLGW